MKTTAWKFLVILFVSSHPALLSAQSSPFGVEGVAKGHLLGMSCNGAGDVNADGYPDFIVGSPFAKPNGFKSGSARVYSGKDGSLLWRFEGHSVRAWFGWAVDGVGDINEDGHDDVVVGAPGDQRVSNWAGSATVYSGANGQALHTWFGDRANRKFGYSVAGLDDLNNDGVNEIIVGRPYNIENNPFEGAAQVFSGLDGSELYYLDAGVWADDFGAAVNDAGDLNGDGVSDIVVGASGNGRGSHGFVRTYSGATGTYPWQASGVDANGAYGLAVASAGDINQDGRSDVIVEAPLSRDRRGLIHVVSGLDGSVLFEFSPPSSNAALNRTLGFSVGGGADLNGDGHPDFFGGAPRHYVQPIGAGKLFVFNGATLTLLHEFSGLQNSGYGRSAGVVGDIDADGYPEIVVGAPTTSHSKDRNGVAMLHSLKSMQLQGPSPGIAGQVNTFQVSDAIPGGVVAIARSYSSGSSSIPGQLGIGLRLTEPKLSGSAVVDANGNATISFFVPPGFAGHTRHYQAVQINPTRISRRIEFRYP